MHWHNIVGLVGVGQKKIWSYWFGQIRVGLFILVLRRVSILKFSTWRVTGRREFWERGREWVSLSVEMEILVIPDCGLCTVKGKVCWTDQGSLLYTIYNIPYSQLCAYWEKDLSFSPSSTPRRLFSRLLAHSQQREREKGLEMTFCRWRNKIQKKSLWMSMWVLSVSSNLTREHHHHKYHASCPY